MPGKELGIGPEQPPTSLRHGALECACATASDLLHSHACRRVVECRRLKGHLVTIYSQHPNRGKVQVLATYRGPAGVVSSTVTSVDDAALAAPIVDALNRISACVTVPISVYDTRSGRFEHYPAEHLVALTDRNARVDLLNGAHSLWYEHVKFLLHQALTDLDDVTTVLPAPIRAAISAELEAEERGLREGLAEYSEGIEPPEAENRRTWDFRAPFVTFDGGLDGLGSDDRDRLNRLERDIATEQLGKGVADLRLLLEAYTRCANYEARLIVDDFLITDDPFDEGSEDLFLNIEAPMPNGAYGRDEWRIEIGQWVPDDPEDPEDEECSSAAGEIVLRCTRPAPPTIDEIVELLNRSGGRSEQLAAWAKTPVGETLTSTAFVVTHRYDD